MLISPAFPPDIIFKAIVEHIDLCLLSLAIACAIAFPLGILTARRQLLSEGLLSVLGVVYTIPSLAMLAILVPIFGLGKGSAIVAIVIYAQFILLRHVVMGLRSVDQASIEAARGLGLTPVQVFTTLEAPMAMPIWINGLRNATLATLSIATIAAWINAGGIGALIFDGLSQNNSAKILTGALLISALSLIFDYLLKSVETEAAQIASGEVS